MMEKNYVGNMVIGIGLYCMWHQEEIYVFCGFPPLIKSCVSNEGVAPIPEQLFLSSWHPNTHRW